MKTHLKILTLVGLLSGGLVYANDKDYEKDKERSQSSEGESTAQPQASISIEEAAGAESKAGTKVSFDELPQEVQKTIRTHAGSLNVEDIQKKEKNGEACYQASFDKDNMKSKLTVAEDGSLLQYQQARDMTVAAVVPEISSSDKELSDLPDAVQKAIEEKAGSAEVGNISESTLQGETVYHAGFNDGASHTDLIVSEDGELLASTQQTALFIAPLESSEKLSLNSAPDPVQQAIREEASAAQVTDIDKGQWNGQTAYKVMVEKEGTPMALLLSESGDVLGREVSEAAGAEPKKHKKDKKHKESQDEKELEDQN